MEPVTKLYLVDQRGERVFGEGPFRLLQAVEATGSLRGAAQSMHMAYTKALKMLRRVEQEVGYPLTQRSVGGRDGGGSRLTEEGKELLSRYERYRDRCQAANRRIYQEIFCAQREEAPADYGEPGEG